MTPYPRFVARQYGPTYRGIASGSRNARVFDFYLFDRVYCYRVVWHRAVSLTRPFELLRARREWRRKFHELNAGTP